LLLNFIVTLMVEETLINVTSLLNWAGLLPGLFFGRPENFNGPTQIAAFSKTPD